ncbi:hypothetical protein VTN00DRAFT_2177 [Thermoascus crustaceus]|uniref:uncharacterized protein n=1 Tax=Thermoascus crustaceus TaxID=5088 RepID=UPI003743333E
MNKDLARESYVHGDSRGSIGGAGPFIEYRLGQTAQANTGERFPWRQQQKQTASRRKLEVPGDVPVQLSDKPDGSTGGAARNLNGNRDGTVTQDLKEAVPGILQRMFESRTNPSGFRAIPARGLHGVGQSMAIRAQGQP